MDLMLGVMLMVMQFTVDLVTARPVERPSVTGAGAVRLDTGDVLECTRRERWSDRVVCDRPAGPVVLRAEMTVR
jgi:hypothetical protein